MEQLEFFAVPSPCVGVCNVDEKGYCQGCMRKREERFTWLQMTPAQQRHVIKLCRQRYRRKMAKKKTSDIEVVQVEDTSPQQDLFG
ncbi:DUF1289 domain-containing protein [Vibrio sp. SCSIO 43136]|uniref:DUF1289 domain-containing protein n=1 Tax=Vibrio sp. SCSIO 43136 TaxID=2819101 RepID=UPI002074B8C8|nr:DUF1289 domain-containing protein [Vibrio sp. SCSIO 43136]USD64175.1 DUF1289 domain-containing protein [Vibrio sp. SCSIO 43136]